MEKSLPSFVVGRLNFLRQGSVLSGSSGWWLKRLDGKNEGLCAFWAVKVAL